MFRKIWILTILIYFIVLLSGCTSILRNVEVVKNNDGTNTVKAYTFGCQNYLPDIYINEQDLSVWEYCPNDVWKIEPPEIDEIRHIPNEDRDKYLKPITKVSMQKCGDIIYKKHPTVLYCGECPDAGAYIGLDHDLNKHI